MREINVCILNMKGNFNKRLGTGTQRTSYELWRNIKPLAKSHGINVEKIEIGSGGAPLVRKMSFVLLLPFHRLESYDIAHLLIPMPLKPKVGRNTKILTTVNEFHLIEKGTVPYERYVRKTISGKPGGPVERFIDAGIKKQIFSSDYISVNSIQTRGEAVSLGYPKNRIFVVNHGVDERFLSPMKHRTGKKFIVGFIGQLNLRKNVSFAIDAFKMIKGDDIEFEVWGNKVLEYENLVKQAGDDSRIKFMGFAPEDSLVEVYDRFDAFVFPSLYEGFGLPIIEAQARGLPVILCRDARIPKETRKYCFEARNEGDMARIIEKMRKNGYSNSMKIRATAYARGFTRKKEALDTLAVYKEIFKRGR